MLKIIKKLKTNILAIIFGVLGIISFIVCRTVKDKIIIFTSYSFYNILNILSFVFIGLAIICVILYMLIIKNGYTKVNSDDILNNLEQMKALEANYRNILKSNNLNNLDSNILNKARTQIENNCKKYENYKIINNKEKILELVKKNQEILNNVSRFLDSFVDSINNQYENEKDLEDLINAFISLQEN